MRIDAYTHFFPAKYFQALVDSKVPDIGKRVREVPAIHDIETRRKVVDSFPDYKQIICVALPPIGTWASPDKAEGIARLANDCKNIIGVKEASGSLDQMQTIKTLCPKEFLLLSGDDALTLPVLSIGGVGVISVAANIIPRDVVGMVEAYQAGRMQEAQELHYN